MVEYAIVGAIVVAVVGLAVRSMYRTLSGKDHSCGCGSHCMSPNACHPASAREAPQPALLEIGGASGVNEEEAG